MKLCDIVGGKVVIHPNLLMIPCFRELWDNDKDDKQHATDVISYIILKNKWDSPYVKTTPPDQLEEKLKNKIFKDPQYVLTTEELLCEAEFYDLMNNTLSSQLLAGLRQKLWAQAKYYNDTKDELLDLDYITKLNKGAGELKKTLDTIDALEKSVHGEELANKKVKGDKEVNPYELANGRL